MSLPTRGYPCVSYRDVAFFYTLVIFIVASCNPASPVVLASIKSVEPAVLEPGDVLVLRGEGFVEGPAEVTLNGSFDPHGMIGAVEKLVRLPGTAVDEETVEVPVTAVAMELIAKEPLLFTGKSRIVFPKTNSLGIMQIEAASGQVSIEFRPAGGGVEIAARRDREAEKLLEKLGLELVTTEQNADLLVASVTTSSAADLNGVTPGDRLLAVDGLALAEPSDLAGLNLGETHRFEFVSSAGNIQTADIQLTPTDPLKMDEFVAVLLTAVALGLFLAFAAPRKKRIRQSSQTTYTFTLAKFFVFGIAVIPLLAFPAIAIVSRADVDATLILLGLLVACLAASTLYGKGAVGSRILGAAAHLMPAPLIVASTGALTSAFGLWNVVSIQESSLWGWNVWSNPFSLAAFIAAVSLLWPSHSSSEGQPSIARAASFGTAIAGAMVIVTFSLGGWSVPGMKTGALANTPVLLLGGSFLFALKTFGVLVAAKKLVALSGGDRRSQRSGAGRILFRVLALILSTVLALAWTWGTLPVEIRSAGQVLSAGIFITLCSGFVAGRVREISSLKQNDGQHEIEQTASAPL